MPDQPVTKVYYNSACPVCRAGVESEREHLEACGINSVEWIDVHQQPEAVQEVGATLEQVRERLYVKGPQGEIAVGAAAVTHLMSRTGRWRWLAFLGRLPILRQLADLAYNGFAKLLYRWNRKRWHW